MGEDPSKKSKGKIGSEKKSDKAKSSVATGHGQKSGPGHKFSPASSKPLKPLKTAKSSSRPRVTQTKGGKPYDRKRPDGWTKNQCQALSKRTGERCGLAAAKGQSVCRFHGGGTQAAKAAGARRWAKREALIQASRLVQKDGVDMDPIDHLLDSLHRASQLVNVYGIMCAEIDAGADERLSDDQTRGELGYEIVEEEVGEGRVVERFVVRSKEKLMALNKHSEAQLHPFLQAYTEALRDRAKFAKMCIDAGLAEMQMELVERQVDMAQEALEATITDMALGAADRRKFVETYARNLRGLGAARAMPALSPGAARR